MRAFPTPKRPSRWRSSRSVAQRSSKDDVAIRQAVRSARMDCWSTMPCGKGRLPVRRPSRPGFVHGANGRDVGQQRGSLGRLAHGRHFAAGRATSPRRGHTRRPRFCQVPAGAPELYELYDDVRAKWGRDVPINICTVRPATEREIEMQRVHDEMVARELVEN